MIVSELVFSVLDISLWIKFPETVVEFASPKKIGHSSVPKKTPGIVVFGSQPMDPPNPVMEILTRPGIILGRDPGRGVFWLGSSILRQKNGGTTDYVHTPEN